jgi:hypothetical protein
MIVEVEKLTTQAAAGAAHESCRKEAPRATKTKSVRTDGIVVHRGEETIRGGERKY